MTTGSKPPIKARACTLYNHSCKHDRHASFVPAYDRNGYAHVQKAHAIALETYATATTSRSAPFAHRLLVQGGGVKVKQWREEFLHLADRVEIQSAEDMEYGEKVYLLDKLSSIKKKIQAVDLKTHIKSVDARVIAEIIRRFEPDATDEDILNIFYEALEKCKNSAR